MNSHFDPGAFLDDLDASKAAHLLPERILIPFSEIEPKPIEWLWTGRLALGTLALLEGDPKAGKSTLWCDLAARISTGSPWPDGRPCPQGDVVVLSAEDMRDRTIRPRLDAAYADVTRIHELQPITDIELIEGETVTRQRFPTLEDVPHLERAIAGCRARLVVVDVMMAYMPVKTDSYRDQSVRTLLMPLAKLAERTNTTVLLLRHLNKSQGGGNILYAGGGSIGIAGAARSILTVGSDGEDPTLRLVQTTSNLAQEQPVLSYRLISDEERGVARIRWEGPVPTPFGGVLAGRYDDDVPDLGRVILDIIEEDGGSMRPSDVLAAVREIFGKDISYKTVQRKARDLGITLERLGDERNNHRWVLPSDGMTGHF